MVRRTHASRRPPSKRRPTLVSRTALCAIAGVSEGQLSLWEHEELIAPVDVEELADRREPLYDSSALRRVRLIRTLGEELDVNLPGIDVILRLLDELSH